MHWIAPTENDNATETLEKRLWDAADQFRENSELKAQEYSGPILGSSSFALRKCATERFAQNWRKVVPRPGAGCARRSRNHINQI